MILPAVSKAPVIGTTSGGALEAAAESGYHVLLAYAIVAVSLIFLARSRAGYAAIYYSLILLILFLFVTQANWFAANLAPLTNKKGLA
jgi:hypothetical protein